MGKPTGFMDYERVDSEAVTPTQRIKNFNEFHKALPLEKQCEQAARCMDCGVPFCQSGKMLKGMISGCPLNNLIPEWNELLYIGNYKRAYHRLAKTSNFPEFTSRVCPALCEKACTCGLNGDAVSTKENEKTIIEYAFEHGYVEPEIPAVRTGKKVAVIGSGPSGLAAADLLNMRGHSVTVYERADRVGGLLMYGIPNMKLEKWVVDRRVEHLKAEGVEFITNADVGGAANPRDIKAEGRDANGIYFAVDYLKSVTKSLLDSDFKDKKYIDPKDKNVVVIGGGDTGNDCVGTSIRLGCKSITQLEMMPKAPDERAANNPWPQWPKVCKTDYGQEEAIAVFGHDPRIYQTTVKEFIKDKNGNLKKLVCVKLESKKDEKTGRFMMAEVAGREKYVTDAFGVEVDARTNVKTAPDAFATSVPKVFAAGDMHIGQSLVVRAIRQGRDVAKEVDKYLMGYTNLE